MLKKALKRPLKKGELNEAGETLCYCCGKETSLLLGAELCLECEKFSCKSCIRYRRQFPYGYICKKCIEKEKIIKNKKDCAFENVQ